MKLKKDYQELNKEILKGFFSAVMNRGYELEGEIVQTAETAEGWDDMYGIIEKPTGEIEFYFELKGKIKPKDKINTRKMGLNNGED